MPKSRRHFLSHASLGVLGAVTTSSEAMQTPPSTPPGNPPAFGTAAPVGPEVSADTLLQAEKLAWVEMTLRERTEAAENWRVCMAPLLERRAGPRKVQLEPTLSPFSCVNPSQLYQTVGPARNQFVRSQPTSILLPSNEGDIAFAPVSQLSRWIQRRQITSQRLTELYLDRIRRFDPKLRCVITLTADLALAQAKKADAEIAAGHYRGPLHGIPWGVQKIFSIQRTFRPLTVPNPSEIAFRR